MGCQRQKCSTPECSIKMKTCEMINGRCPQCYQKQKEELRKQQLNNVPNQFRINR